MYRHIELNKLHRWLKQVGTVLVRLWYGFGTGLVRAVPLYFTMFLIHLLRVLVRVWYGFGTVLLRVCFC